MTQTKKNIKALRSIAWLRAADLLISPATAYKWVVEHLIQARIRRDQCILDTCIMLHLLHQQVDWLCLGVRSWHCFLCPAIESQILQNQKSQQNCNSQSEHRVSRMQHNIGSCYIYMYIYIYTQGHAVSPTIPSPAIFIPAFSDTAPPGISCLMLKPASWCMGKNGAPRHKW